MRKAALVIVLCATAGCATSNGTPTLRQDCEDRYDTIWVAAQTAVGRLGGSVVSANRSAGVILGRLESDILGTVIDLDITLRRLPDHQPGTQEPVTVAITATDSRVAEPDAHRIQELRTIEEHYLRLVRERVPCGGPM